MKIGIISGSHRSKSQSEKVAKHIEKELLSDQDIETYLFLLEGNPLPLWDEQIWKNDDEWVTLLKPIKEQLENCDAFVVVAPEWHGQIPSGLKNFFLIFGKAELGHKPAMIVGVSNNVGGTYPVAELRMSSYKNNRICYIPEHLIVRNVESVFNENPDDNDVDANQYFEQRTRWTLDVLLAYAKALKPVRESGILFNDSFSNGM